MIGLYTEPGAHLPWMARLSIGVAGSALSATHSLLAKPATNLLGSYTGELAIASTSPFRGSSATTEPLRPSSPSSATTCRSRSSVSCRLFPVTGSICPMISSWRRRLSTRICRFPSRPASQASYWRSMPLLPISVPYRCRRNSRWLSSLLLISPTYPIACTATPVSAYCRCMVSMMWISCSSLRRACRNASAEADRFSCSSIYPELSNSSASRTRSRTCSKSSPNPSAMRGRFSGSASCRSIIAVGASRLCTSTLPRRSRMLPRAADMGRVVILFRSAFAE